ncbi:uncharacterized protein LOC133818459 [Humulus lupulus]|uniref:uncharacterized protein LOC133818459 n=1 Tax=Humulus lupulus TaxID=3486 RepID=UPI002B400E6A|nr:uncharacterized protein LOC133818459 [Humulus lupulus]
MKKPGLLAASVAVASASAYFDSSYSSSFVCNPSVQFSHKGGEGENKNSSGETKISKDKFAPRFNGLRFIETLITAHR